MTDRYTYQGALSQAMRRGPGRLNTRAETPALSSGKVIGVHPETNTVDIATYMGNYLYGVGVLRGAAGTQGGLAYLQTVTTLTQARVPQGALDPTTDDAQHSVIALLGYVEGSPFLPVVLGFRFPPATQMLFAEAGLLIDRHAESGVYRLIDAAGNHELVLPDGSYEHWGPPGSSHRTLTGTDAQKSWTIPPASVGVYTLHHASGTEISINTAGAVTVSGPLAGTKTVHGGQAVLPYGATISLNPALADQFTLTMTGNATLNATSGGVAGQRLTLIITNDATSPRTLTFGTHFRSSGSLVGTTSMAATVSFSSDGTSLFETNRVSPL